MFLRLQNSTPSSISVDQSIQLCLRERTLLLSIIMLTILLALLCRIAYLQLANFDKYATQAEQNSIDTRVLRASRGNIYDSNGVVLATNISIGTLVFKPTLQREKDIAILQILTDILGADQQALRKYQAMLAAYHPSQGTIEIKKNISKEETAIIAANSYRLPHVRIAHKQVRFYPYNQITSHVLGYISIDAAEKQQRGAKHQVGVLGIEQQYDSVLQSKNGWREVEINARGQVQRTLLQQPGENGDNIYLSLDIKLQLAAYNALGKKKGAVVVIDIATGNILALANKPGYASNKLMVGVNHTEYRKLFENEHKPFLNRAVSGMYPPGSVIKVFYAMQMLKTNTVSPNTTIYDNGWYSLLQEDGSKKIFRNWHRTASGVVDLKRAIITSNDTYFYTIAEKVRNSFFQDSLRSFAFDKKTGVDLPFEPTPVIPDSEWKFKKFGAPWFRGDNLNFSIGQGFLQVSTLQLAQATAVLARQGIWLPTHLLLAINTNKVKWKNQKPQVLIEAPQWQWQLVHTAMYNVLHGKEGTARRAGYSLQGKGAGKTGTSQVIALGKKKYNAASLPEKFRDHAVFIGFYPFDKPKIALAVLLEHGGSGGKDAGPVAVAVFNAYHNLTQLL